MYGIDEYHIQFAVNVDLWRSKNWRMK